MGKNNLTLESWHNQEIIKNGTLAEKEMIYLEFLRKVELPENSLHKKQWLRKLEGKPYIIRHWRLGLMLLLPFIVVGLATQLNSFLYTGFVIGCLAIPWLLFSLLGIIVWLGGLAYLDAMAEIRQEIDNANQ